MVSNSQFTSHSPNSYSSSSRSSFSSSTSSNNYSPYSPCSSSNSLNYQHHTKPTNHLNSKSFGSLKPISIELTAPPSPPMIQPISSLANFAAEMMVWLWFEDDAVIVGGKGKEISKNQIAPSSKFLRFCHEVLATTQVSHSVVLLALLFIYRLKSQNSIKGSLGSEFRLAVTALMMANKILDDNTYTAKTWAEVSCLELKALVAGEAEFLQGLSFQLHVSEKDFNGWTNLLDGHVVARKSLLNVNKVLTKSTGSQLRNISRGGLELIGLGVSGGVSFGLEQDQEIQQRRHSTVESSTSGSSSLSTFTFPPRHSSLSNESFLTSSSSTTAPHYIPSSVPRRSTTNHSRNRSYPPHSLVNNTIFPRFDNRNNSTTSLTSSSFSSKRRADTAFSEDEGHYLPVAKRLVPSWGSYSVGSSPQFNSESVLLPEIPMMNSTIENFTFPSSIQVSSSNSNIAERIIQSSDGTFHHLIDAFSPTYGPNHLQSRHENLSFYSLAAGHRGLPRHALPLDPRTHVYPPTNFQYPILSPVTTSSYNTSPPIQSFQQNSPPYNSQPQQPPQIRPSQSPSEYYNSPSRTSIPRSPSDYYSSTPPQSGYGLVQTFNHPTISYSYFSNAGVPGVWWPLAQA